MRFLEIDASCMQLLVLMENASWALGMHVIVVIVRAFPHFKEVSKHFWRFPGFPRASLLLINLHCFWHFPRPYQGHLNTHNSFRLGVFLRNSAPIPATELSSRLPGDTPSSFMLSGYGSDLRFLGGGYECSKFPGKLGKKRVTRFWSTSLSGSYDLSRDTLFSLIISL